MKEEEVEEVVAGEKDFFSDGFWSKTVTEFMVECFSINLYKKKDKSKQMNDVNNNNNLLFSFVLNSHFCKNSKLCDGKEDE